MSGFETTLDKISFERVQKEMPYPKDTFLKRKPVILSKRELFALRAMTAVASGNHGTTAQEIAWRSVRIADEILKKLAE